MGIGCTLPHWKALRCGKYETRGLSCGSTSNICQDVLKSNNSLHKTGIVNSRSQITVFVISSCIEEIKRHRKVRELDYLFSIDILFGQFCQEKIFVLFQKFSQLVGLVRKSKVKKTMIVYFS